MIKNSMNKIPEKEQRILNDYLQWTISDECPKKFKSRFNTIHKYDLDYFINYLIEKKCMRPSRIINLLKLLNKNIRDYIIYLKEKYDSTSTVTKRLNFISGFICFCKTKTNWYIKEYDSTINNVKKDFLENIEIKPSKKMINKMETMNKIDFRNIVENIYGLETSTWYQTQKKFIFMVLLKMGWRTKNIISLRFKDEFNREGNLEYMQNKWYYTFLPEEQKSPKKINGFMSPIVGKLPCNVGEVLNLLLKQRRKEGINNYELILTKEKKKMSDTTFSQNVRKWTKYQLKIQMNPHIFRSIVPSAAINHISSAQFIDIWLWHFPANAKSTRHYLEIDINKAVNEISKFIDGVADGSIILDE